MKRTAGQAITAGVPMVLSLVAGRQLYIFIIVNPNRQLFLSLPTSETEVSQIT